MKKLILGLLLAGGLLGPAAAQSYHKGYATPNGTYVQPHWQSAPNKSYNDNWGVQGNTNPFTGQQGTLPRTLNDQPPAPAFGSPTPQRRGSAYR